MNVQEGDVVRAKHHLQLRTRSGKHQTKMADGGTIYLIHRVDALGYLLLVPKWDTGWISDWTVDANLRPLGPLEQLAECAK